MKQIGLNIILLFGLFIMLGVSRDVEGIWGVVLSIVGGVMILVALDYKIDHKNK